MESKNIENKKERNQPGQNKNGETKRNVTLFSLKFISKASSRLLKSVAKAILEYPGDESSIREVANTFDTSEEVVKAVISNLTQSGIDGVEECISKLYVLKSNYPK